MDEQKCNLKEGCTFSQLFDWVASILQDPFVSIDEADFGSGADGVHVSRIINSERLLVIALELGEIFGVDEIGIFGFLDSYIIGFSCPVVSDLETISV